VLSTVLTFWQRSPALFYGLFFCLGTIIALVPSATSLSAVVPVVFLILPYIYARTWTAWCKALLGVATAIAAYCAAGYSTLPPTLSKVRIDGTVRIENITQDVRFGEQIWKYHIRLTDERLQLYNVACTMRRKGEGLCPQYTYRASGMLQRYDSAHAVFTPYTLQCCREPAFSYAGWRFTAKRQLRCFLSAKLPPNEARGFLEGLITGEFHDPLLAKNLSRFGLQHIMVVSGFHFSLLISCIAFLLRFIVGWRYVGVALLFAMTGYFLFLGPSPSVMRAYVASALLGIASLAEKRTYALNSLGASLILLLWYEPTFALQPSFQLSFLATAAILFFYNPVDMLLRQIFVPRTALGILSLPVLDQALYILLVFFRKMWSLGIAVHVIMLPVCLYMFQTFPLMSLFYNCFFPFLVTLAMILLLLACLLFWCPLVSEMLFSCTSHFTEWLLSYVYYAPHTLDKALIVPLIPGWAVVVYLTLALFVGIYSTAPRELNDPLGQ